MSSPKVQVTPDLTRKVAHLARLELSEQEVQTFTEQLQNILAYVDLLNEVSVDQIEPISQALAPRETTAWREDEARPFGRDAEGRPAVLSSAPEVVDDGFKVPQIIA